MDTKEERLDAILAGENYLVLGTAGPDGQPWTAPLYFASDERRHLFFISRRDSAHAEHLRGRSAVSVSIFNSGCAPGHCDGVQLSGEARELDQIGAIAHAAKVLFSKRFEDIRKRRDYLEPTKYIKNSSGLRLYEVRPTAIWLVDQDKPNDHRTKVQIDAS